MIFRRRRDESQEHVAEDPGSDPVEPAEAEPDPRAGAGPWDSAERPPDLDDPRVVDLGGLVITGHPGLELRLQTDPDAGTVTAIMLADRDGGVELRAFAATRSGGIWDDLRRDIAAEAARHGGTATETPGEYGTELRVRVPVHDPAGRPATQVSRIVGIEGPRWMLRATYVGKHATTPDPGAPLVQAVRDVVVVRGTGPMPPREPLPLRLPPGAQLHPEPPE